MLKLNKNKKDLTINLKEITYNKFNTKKTKMIKDILKARRTNEIKQTIKFILCVAVFFFILIAGILIPKDRTNATEEVSIATKIRLERIEACSNALDDSVLLYNEAEYTKLVLDCAMRMTGVYIVESGYGKHEIRKNNFLGLKRKVNGIYGFHSFATGYDCRYYFATKFYKWHYKKSPRKFIYGYWIDGGWKFGWSATQKESYTQTLTKIENNQDLRNSYTNLYLTN